MDKERLWKGKWTITLKSYIYKSGWVPLVASMKHIAAHLLITQLLRQRNSICKSLNTVLTFICSPKKEKKNNDEEKQLHLAQLVLIWRYLRNRKVIITKLYVNHVTMWLFFFSFEKDLRQWMANLYKVYTINKWQVTQRNERRESS